ncbi:MAG TPA: dihydrolipoyl dehydrogenase [Candidatus Omnitrophota bacterium]|nr:dihydrolipoyl dehydrogenase [Candidatus Omnitrophota bacterium]
MSDKFDIIVLGGGPGGYAAAIRAAQLGARVALVEKDRTGGTCLNRGCIPTKALIACSSLYERIGNARKFGISAENTTIDLNAVIDRKNAVVEKAIKNLEVVIRNNKIEIIRGTGKVIEPGKVEIESVESGKSTVESRILILATGSSPAPLPGLPFDRDRFLSSDDILDNRTPLERLDIVGGGVIGIHFAQFYASIGCKVTIHEALPEILPGVDEEIVGLVKRVLKRKDVNILTGTRFEPSKAEGETLICVGRVPNLSGIEALSLKMDKRSVAVNDKMGTSMKHVYAVGDLASKKMLAHVAFEQGVVAAENAMGGNRTFSYDNIPFAIYTSPEIGCVGMTEKEALAAGKSIKIGKFPFAALGISQAVGEIEGKIKVVADEAGTILGVHILGPEATTLIGSATLAIKNGLKLEQLAETFEAHPTYSEGLQEAALNALKRSLHILN